MYPSLRTGRLAVKLKAGYLAEPDQFADERKVLAELLSPASRDLEVMTVRTLP